MQELQWSSLFAINVVLDGIALVIIAVLLVRIIPMKQNLTEIRMFYGMCVMNILLAVIDAVKFLQFILFANNNTVSEAYVMICIPVGEILSMMIVVQWLLFVNFSLHQSRDLIRRRYPVILIPFFAAVILQLGSIVLVIAGFISKRSETLFEGDILYFLSALILLFYIAVAIVIVHREKKRKRLPRFVAIVPMAICVLFGYLLDLFTNFSLLPLFLAAGLISVEYSIMKQSSYEDYKTGYFNRKYVRKIMDYIEHNEIKGGTVIRFSTESDASSFAKILHRMEPDNNKTIFMGDGLFLVVSETQSEAVINRYTSVIIRESERRGLNIKEEHFTRTDEEPEEFFAGIIHGNRDRNGASAEEREKV